MAVLNKISNKIPVAVITTKDLSFVVKRTPFARAWSALGGLEMRIGSLVTGASCLKERMPYLVNIIEYARSLSDNYLAIEEKQDSSGTTVAFSVDWRLAKDRRKALARAMKILDNCKKLPLVTIEHGSQPFFDVFPCAIDKGRALLRLKKKLGLREGVLYMGDSSDDNSAFEAADIAIGVLHRETPDDLACDHFVRFEDLSVFLQSLLENDFLFTPRLRMVLHRTEALQYIRQRKTYVNKPKHPS